MNRNSKGSGGVTGNLHSLAIDRNIPTVFQLYDIISNNEKSILFLFTGGYLNDLEGTNCKKSHCHGIYHKTFYENSHFYKCNNYKCKNKIAVTYNTIFYGISIPIGQVISMFYYWTLKIKIKNIII